MEYKVIIIGAGVSGMTAAIYLKRAGISCCIIEEASPGGQINYTTNIENYPGCPDILGPDLAYNIYEQTSKLGVPFLFEKVININTEEEIKEIKTNKQTLKAKYIIIATGRTPRKLGIPDEEKFMGKGISYCAICDGPLFKDKDVIVIGSGDSAVKESLFLSNICNKVTLLNRRESFRSKEDLTNLKSKENIEIKLNSEVKSFVSKGDLLEKVILKNDEELSCQGCFIFIGYEPNTKIFEELGILDNEKYIKTNTNCETNISNIFAIGDVRKKEIFQILTAMNDAVVVSNSIIDRI